MPPEPVCRELPEYKVSFPSVACHCAVRLLLIGTLLTFVKEQIHCFPDGIGETKPYIG